MTGEAFYKQMKLGIVQRCYLFDGEEEYTKEAAVRTLQSKVLKGEFAELNLSRLVSPPVDEIIAHAETLPLMAERRMVIVRDCAFFTGKSTGEGEGEKEGTSFSDADKLCDYLERLPGTVCLLFVVRGKANGTRKLYKRIQKAEGVVTFETLDQSTMIKWIARELKRYDKAVEHSTAEQIAFALGGDMHALAGELAKLAAHAGDNPSVTMEDFQAVGTKSVEYRVFDLSDALIAGQARRATGLMHDMLVEGEERLMLLALLQRQYRQLLFAKILADSRVPSDQAARQLSVPPFVARKMMQQAGRYSIGSLKEACDLLIDTEYQVKSGQIPEEGSLEQAVFRIMAAGQEVSRGE
jgi:DNA polymerase-3 subunit delta